MTPRRKHLSTRFLGILVAVEIRLAFKAKLEQSRRYLGPIGGVRGLLDKLREVFFDRRDMDFHALLVDRELFVEVLAGTGDALRDVFLSLHVPPVR